MPRWTSASRCPAQWTCPRWTGKWKGWGKGKDGKNGKTGKSDPKGKRNGKDGKGKNPEGKAKTEPFDGYCNGCKKHGHRERVCWAK
mgnify:CR=1 FL=1